MRSRWTQRISAAAIAATAMFAGQRAANADEVWQSLGGGMNESVFVITEYNGELIAAGEFTKAGGVAANRIARWDGSTWQSLGSGMNDSVYTLAVFNGELIAGGAFASAGGVAANRIARWDGSNWQPLGSGVESGPGLSYYVFALTAYKGELVASGAFTSAGGEPANGIARWDGSTWQPLGSGLEGWVTELTVFNGELIASGDFTTAGGVAANRIARWDGSTWQTFGSGMGGDFSSVSALTEYNGELIAGGNFTSAGGVAANRIARWDGSNWHPLGSGIGGEYSGVAVLTEYNGELIAGGYFNTAGGVAANYIARWNGLNWQPQLGSGMNSSVSALKVYNGALIAGGDFTAAGGETVNYIASTAASSTSAACELWQSLGGGINASVAELTVFDDDLIASGEFVSAGGAEANRIARWDGSTWLPMGGGMNESVVALTVYNSELIAGGFFTSAAGVAANYVARWNGAEWQPLGSGMNSDVLALTVYDGELIAGGRFTQAGGVAANRIARWNGSTWQPIGSGMDVAAGFSTYVLALTEYNGELIAGGAFTSAGDVAVSDIASWNGATWQPLGSGFSGGFGDASVQVLTKYNGELIAGGDFTTAGGVAANRIASWNGSIWQPLGSGIESAPMYGTYVWALSVYNDELVAGGFFTIAGGVEVRQIARWNGATWQPLGIGTGEVYALAVFDGELIAGLYSFGGANAIARWSPNVWLVPRSGDFHDSGNWDYRFRPESLTSFGATPGINPLTVFFDSDAQSSELCVTNQQPTFDLNGHTFDISNVTTIGAFEVSNLTIDEGVLKSPTVGVGSFGTLGGDGSIVGNVFNVGVVRPGNSPIAPGTLTLTGNYEQTFGTFKPNFSPSSHGRLDVTQYASIAGTLKIDLVGSPTFELGQEFPVLTCTSLTGTFGAAVLPFVGDNLVLNVQYNDGGAADDEDGGGVAGGGQGVVIVVGQPDGSPEFGESTEVVIEGEPTGVTGADVNPLIQDRDLALSMKSIPAGSPGNAVILINLGDGEEFEQPIIEPVGVDPSGIVCAALANGDAEDDFAISNFGDDSVSVLFHDGGGAFTRLDIPSAPGSGPSAITAGDFNGDTLIDLAVTNQLDHTVTVLLNDGDRTFSNGPESPMAVGNSPVAIATAELNGLPGGDLVVAAMGFNGVWIIPSIGGGGFGNPTIIPTGITPTSVTPGDIENDKDFDLIVGNSGSGTMSLIVNEGGGSFAPPVDLPVDGSPVPGAVTSWDMDADEDLDLVGIVDDATLGLVIRILRNDTPEGSSEFAFTILPDEGVGENPRLIRGSDVTGDLAEDLVAVNIVQTALAGPASSSLTVRPNISLFVAGDANSDGLVNVEDIAAIMDGWGPCPAQPTSCDGDVFPPSNGNGVVDIDDLLEVIGNWPVPG